MEVTRSNAYSQPTIALVIPACPDGTTNITAVTLAAPAASELGSEITGESYPGPAPSAGPGLPNQ